MIRLTLDEERKQIPYTSSSYQSLRCCVCKKTIEDDESMIQITCIHNWLGQERSKVCVHGSVSECFRKFRMDDGLWHDFRQCPACTPYTFSVNTPSRRLRNTYVRLYNGGNPVPTNGIHTATMVCPEAAYFESALAAGGLFLMFTICGACLVFKHLDGALAWLTWLALTLLLAVIHRKWVHQSCVAFLLQD